MAVIKILLVGDIGTGKDSYVRILIGKSYVILRDEKRSKRTSKTRKANTISISITIDRNTSLDVDILKIPGCMRGNSVIKQNIENADGCMVMFDITRPTTYDSVIGWTSDIRNMNDSRDMPFFLLGNKFDLEKHEDINLNPNFMAEYCDANQFSHWFRTSSTDDLNIYESIWYLCNKIIKIRQSLAIIHLSSPILNEQKRKRLMKFVVIGACGTGKTSIIRRFVDNSFKESYRATSGIDCLAKTIREKDIPIDLHIWDVSGRELFYNFTHLFYKDADAFLIVFDVNKPSTLENDALKWKLDLDRKVKSVEDKRIPCFLIGNKYDPSKREILTDGDSMKKFCRSHEFSQYLNVSARANSNIDNAFSRILTVAIACHNVEQEVGREQSQQHE
ncbi:unnamed protein product [Adineta ricciae]|nr:unnamed protein product [Adineta ricciae]